MFQDFPRGLHFLTIEDFEPRLGENFFIEADGGDPLRLRLDRLVPIQGPDLLPRAPFVLHWSTDPSFHLLHGIYRLRHLGWGPHGVYIEPMRPKDERFVYESVFL
jgi:hypothetical protein